MALIWILSLTFSAHYIIESYTFTKLCHIRVLIQLYLILTVPLNAFILLCWVFLINLYLYYFIVLYLLLFYVYLLKCLK